MTFDQKVIAIIPARGGSKGVPRKNIRSLAGKSLIAYTIETALQSKYLDRIIVSTDDEKIAEIARKYGAEVPFIRPHKLALDHVPDLPVFRHALIWLRENENYCPDIVLNLRPVAPLRAVGDIEAVVEKMLSTNCDSVRTVCEVEHHPYWMKVLHGDRALPLIEGKDEIIYYQRQKLPPVYRITASVDAMRTKCIMKGDSLYGKDMRVVIVPVERSVDIDKEIDFNIAECLMRHRGE